VLVDALVDALDTARRGEDIEKGQRRVSSLAESWTRVARLAEVLGVVLLDNPFQRRLGQAGLV
jgi:hypothetical protein